MKNNLFFGILMFVCGISSAQNTTLQTELKKGEALHAAYRFDEAIAIFSTILKNATDSTFRAEVIRKITFCENGKQMLQFAYTPNVTTKGTVPVKNFYTAYNINLPGKWALTPKILLTHMDTSLIDPFLFVPSRNLETLYFSSRGQEGYTGWDIYETHRMPNGEWSTPERLSEIINTPFDERFPYASPDGMTLYFSSTGHYSMGGYDLYKSVRNASTGEWETPENLGFPFSSTRHDMLYVPDKEGLYACFVSTREEQENNLNIYKIMLEGTTVKKAITEPAEILYMEKLHPGDTDSETINTLSPATNTQDAKYNAGLKKTRQIILQISETQKTLDSLRLEYAVTKDEQTRKSIARKIELREQALSQYNSELQQTYADIRQLEYDMLNRGIVPAGDIVLQPETTVRQPVQQESFTPNPAQMTVLNKFVVQAPIVVVEEEKDFTFRTHATTQIFYDEVVDGISYRIQTGVFSRKLTEKDFKGFTPVFAIERNKKWVYAIGSFSLYAEAQKHLPVVKRSFKDAIITAYKNGKSIPVKQGRMEEGKNPVKVSRTPVSSKTDVAYQLVLGEYPSGLPQNLLKVLQQATNKDIARAVNNGKTEYIVGPYTTEKEAAKVEEILHHSGFTAVKMKKIE